MCASALKQYTQVELKTGFVNKFVDFCQKNWLRGGKRFYQEDSSEVRSSGLRSLEVRLDGGFKKIQQRQEGFQRIQQRQGMLKRSVEAAFLFLFWLQSWLHVLQFALNTAFASVKQVSIIQSCCADECGKVVADARHLAGKLGAVVGRFTGGCGVVAGKLWDVARSVMLGVSVASVVAVAVSQALTGYACVFQGWLAPGAGARPPTTRSTHLWVCYQKFFRFWANAKTQTKTLIAISENAQNVQKHARQVLYIALILLDCLLKNKNTPNFFTFE